MAAAEEDTKKKPMLAAAATSAAGGVDGGDVEPKHTAVEKVPMPQEYIAAILSMKRERPLSPEEMARLSPEELREEEERKELDDSFQEFQAKVRRDVENNGCYMVDESYLAESAEFQRELKEGWAKIDFSGVIVGEWEYDNPDCCTSL